MRKITEEAIKALFSHKPFKKSNTQVVVNKNKSELLLHDNCIATLYKGNEKIEIDTCGWHSSTTKERLNAIPNVKVTHRNFKLFLNNRPWDGKKIRLYINQ